MKKYLVLTSMLALVACGGGSGGYHGGAIGGTPDVNPPEPVVRVNGPVSDDVINSNQEVTGMLSEIGGDLGRIN